jgi:hypothetical protein
MRRSGSTPGFTSRLQPTAYGASDHTLLADAQPGRKHGGAVNAVSCLEVTISRDPLRISDQARPRGLRDPLTTDGPANFPLVRSTDGSPVLLDGRAIAPANPVGGEDLHSRSIWLFVYRRVYVPRKDLFFSYEHQEINASRVNFAVPISRATLGPSTLPVRSVSARIHEVQ